jgi:peptidyl-prolyl cis-trans isomerase A (cyclophilin A)
MAAGSFAQAPAPEATPTIEEIRSQIQGVIERSVGAREFPSGTYAVMHTSAGDVVILLNRESAPNGVQNFIGLATGAKRWTHPITRSDQQTSLYEGTHFYKVVPNALVFGGDPINRGEGDPGFSLDHELGDNRDFSSPGVLAMQTNGPKSNGSRFFLTLRAFPEYEDSHTVIGRVVAGLDVVQAISNAPTRRPTIPLDPHVLYSVEVLEVPEGKVARGEFRDEDGRPVITIQRELSEAPQASATVVDDPATTPTESQD